MEVTEYLLSQGASVHARDMFNRTPLDDAIKFRKKAIVKRLVQAGAILDKKSTEVASEICSLAAKNRVDDLCIWSLAGADLNVCDYDGRTPLHIVSTDLKDSLLLQLSESYTLFKCDAIKTTDCFCISSLKIERSPISERSPSIVKSYVPSSYF